MKKGIVFLLIVVVALSGCRKDVAPALATPKSFSFENSTLKMEVVSTHIPSDYIRDMHFFNETTGIVITYDGQVFKTNDKGNSWALKYTNPVTNQPLFQLMFTDSMTGYVVGGANWCDGTGCTCPGGLVLKTTDGGETWKNVFQITGQTEFDGIAANSSGDLFLIQNGFSGPGQSAGKILKSSNGGLNWAMVDSSNYQFLKIAFNGNVGFCTGGGNGNAIIIRSIDDGNTWGNPTTLGGLWAGDISFNSNVGYCTTDFSFVYKTIDNGNTWGQIFYSSQFSPYKLSPLTATSCLIWGSEGYSGGDDGYSYGAVNQTTNASGSWTDSRFKDIGGIYFSSFYSATEGYIMPGELIKVTVK